LVTGKFPVTPVLKGKPVKLVAVPLDGVPRAPPLTKLPLAVPVKAAVIVPAVKLPEASRATIELAVLADAAVVAELLTFNAVAIVASLVSTIAAAAFISALTIEPAVIDVALPTDVIGPVRLAFIVAVPVAFPVPPLATGNAVPEYVIANVPEVVIGEPETLKMLGTVAATLVTDPLPLLLNVVQSALVRYPLTDVVAAAIEIAGVAPPELTTGAVPVTLVTVPCGLAAVVMPVTRP
jgi:hypothetical protein